MTAADVKKSILLADDEQGFRDLFHFTFEPLGIEVVTVSDGLEALEAARRRPFDLVVLDVHMPKMGGPEAVHKIRAIRPEQKILVVSSSSDMAFSVEARMAAAGAADCLFKPIGLDELLAFVDRALGPGTVPGLSLRGAS